MNTAIIIPTIIAIIVVIIVRTMLIIMIAMSMVMVIMMMRMARMLVSTMMRITTMIITAMLTLIFSQERRPSEAPQQEGHEGKGKGKEEWEAEGLVWHEGGWWAPEEEWEGEEWAWEDWSAEQAAWYSTAQAEGVWVDEPKEATKQEKEEEQADPPEELETKKEEEEEEDEASAPGVAEVQFQADPNEYWNSPQALAAEAMMAAQHEIGWAQRGPPGPAEGGPALWRGQPYRPVAKKWAKRGGSHLAYYNALYGQKGQQALKGKGKGKATKGKGKGKGKGSSSASSADVVHVDD